MSIWQTLIFSALAACAIGCLWVIYKAIENLTNGIFALRVELTKMNTKLQAIEVSQTDPSFESAIRDIESLVKPRA